MLSDAERLRLYGSAEAVAAVDAHLDRLAAAAPELTPGQAARLRALILPSTAPSEPAERARAA